MKGDFAVVFSNVIERLFSNGLGDFAVFGRIDKREARLYKR